MKRTNWPLVITLGLGIYAVNLGLAALILWLVDLLGGPEITLEGALVLALILQGLQIFVVWIGTRDGI